MRGGNSTNASGRDQALEARFDADPALWQDLQAAIYTADAATVAGVDTATFAAAVATIAAALAAEGVGDA